MRETLYLIGGSGFIGKNFIDLFSTKYDIKVFDKFIDKAFFVKHKDVETYRLNLSEEQIPSEFPTPDFIVNLASVVTAERDLSLFNDLISSNLNILLNLYNRFGKDNDLKLFVQFGSSEEYGSETPPFHESQREVPTSPYALIKQLTVNSSMMLYSNYGFPVCAIRPANVFGRYQSKTKFIPYVIDQLMHNNDVSVTQCEQKRDTLSATDFCILLEKVISNYPKAIGRIVNIGSGESVKLKEIIEFSKEYIGSKSVVHYGVIPYRENEVMDLRCSIDNLCSLINEDVKLDLKKSLKSYIDTL